jgi:hypothetical protein
VNIFRRARDDIGVETVDLNALSFILVGCGNNLGSSASNSWELGLYLFTSMILSRGNRRDGMLIASQAMR